MAELNLKKITDKLNRFLNDRSLIKVQYMY